MERYYYIRDDKNRPIITVCIIDVDTDIGRGIAICSELDQPCKKVGRAIARTRALYALAYEKNSCKIGRWNFKNIREVDKEFMNGFVPFTTKSSYMPELTDYEQKLFKNKKENYANNENDLQEMRA